MHRYEKNKKKENEFSNKLNFVKKQQKQKILSKII